MPDIKIDSLLMEKFMEYDRLNRQEQVRAEGFLTIFPTIVDIKLLEWGLSDVPVPVKLVAAHECIADALRLHKTDFIIRQQAAQQAAYEAEKERLSKLFEEKERQKKAEERTRTEDANRRRRAQEDQQKRRGQKEDEDYQRYYEKKRAWNPGAENPYENPYETPLYRSNGDFEFDNTELNEFFRAFNRRQEQQDEQQKRAREDAKAKAAQEKTTKEREERERAQRAQENRRSGNAWDDSRYNGGGSYGWGTHNTQEKKRPQSPPPKLRHTPEVEFYLILQLPASAAFALIKEAYRAAMMRLHPDKNQNAVPTVREENERQAKILTDQYTNRKGRFQRSGV